MRTASPRSALGQIKVVEEIYMRRVLFAMVAAATVSTAFAAAPEAVKRIDESAKVLDEIMSAPDKGIPRDLFDKATCVGIVPGVKRAGFIVGAKYGKGILTCRDSKYGWTGPSTVRIEGGNIGLQIGGGETDVVLMVMNDRGKERLLKSQFTIGGDASAMAGPVGRSAEAKTDAYMSAEILSYSRSRGAFAGVTLDGATLRSDDDDNAKIYGKRVNHEDILNGKVPPPASAKPLYAALRSVPPDPDAGTRAREKQK
jgi:lipid-binding SYLF domain-containing protein